jgi:hypothetical protein
VSAETPTRWRNRIVGYGEEDPEQLAANPANWRVHSHTQEHTLTGILDEVGWVQNIIVNRTTGFVVDGHLRVMASIQGGETRVPVTYVELTPEEEGKILASFDPISAMAGKDFEKLAELANDIQWQDDALRSLMADLTGDAGLAADIANQTPAAAPDLPAGEDDWDEPDHNEDGDDDEAGTLLAVADVTVTDPRTVVKARDTWRLGRHTLICIDVFGGWPTYTLHLHDDQEGKSLLVPFPGPFVPLSDKADQYHLVMVQPDPYICGHIIDAWQAATGQTAEMVQRWGERS